MKCWATAVIVYVLYPWAGHGTDFPQNAADLPFLEHQAIYYDGFSVYKGNAAYNSFNVNEISHDTEQNNDTPQPDKDTKTVPPATDK